MSSIDGTKYDASVFLGKFDIVRESGTSAAAGEEIRKWPVPSWTQEEIDKLARGEEIGGTLELYPAPMNTPKLLEIV
ncbi:MAG: hypothetical protein ACKOCH_16370, partial [Bacteroidota bacterium]